MRGTGLSVSEVQGAGANVGNAVATAMSGSVTLDADGSFTYDPPAGYVGNDTFTYQVSGASGTSNAATVTITISDMIWFIDNSAAGPGDGRLINPFTTISGFNAVQGARRPGAINGDSIFIDAGNASYTTGISLRTDQILIGEAAGATIETISGITLPSFSRTLPSTGGMAPVLTDTDAGDHAVNLATNNAIRGLDIGNTGGTGINGTEVGTLSVREVGVSGSGGGVDLRSTSGSAIDVTLDSLSSSSSTDEGIVLSNVSGSFSITATNGTISSTNVPAIAITGAADPNEVVLGMTFSSINSTNSSGSGIDLTNIGANSTFNGGATTVGNASSNGIRIQGVDGGSDIDFGTTNINNRNATGIFLDNVSDAGGTVGFGITTIPNPNNASGYGIRIEDSGAAFTFAATNVSDTAVGTAGTYNPVTERPINDGDGDGIFLKNNSGSVTINGGTISDIADNAIDIRNSDNTILNNIVIQDGSDGNTYSTVNSAIQWHQGSDLTLNGVNMSNIGDDTPVSTTGVNVSDDGLKIYDVSGDLIIQNSTFNTATGYVLANATSGSENRAVELDNDTGTNLDVTVTGSSFTNWDFQGLNLRHIGGTLDVDIGDGTVAGANTFQNINGAAVNTGPSAGALTNDHTLDLYRNTFTTVGIAAEVFSSNGGTSTVRIVNNTITGTTSDALRLVAFNNAPVGGAADARYYARVTGNTITNVANNVPGAGGGSGLFVAIEDDATAQVLFDTNTVSGHTNALGDPALFVTTQHQRGGDLDLVITSNTFSNPTNNFFGAIFLQLNGSEITGTSVSNQCVRLGSNSYTNATIGLFSNSHAVDFIPDGGNDVFSVQGFTGSTAANFDAFLSGVETSFTGGGPSTLFFGTAPGNATCTTSNVPAAP